MMQWLWKCQMTWRDMSKSRRVMYEPGPSPFQPLIKKKLSFLTENFLGTIWHDMPLYKKLTPQVTRVI